jgi:predicted HicB family RNase H-like nuclease
MKRIIDGVTYNTDTATKITRSSPEDDIYQSGLPLLRKELYQTRHAAFFLVQWNEVDYVEEIIPLDDEQAKKFLEVNANDLLEKYFGPFPEAGAAERRLTIRLPINLAGRIETAAKNKGLSLNSYAMRCFEQCAASDGARRDISS